MNNDFVDLGELRNLNHLQGASQERGFRRLMYGDWAQETEQERALRTIAEEYHTLCDSYDRAVCSGISPRTGEAMPIDPDEARASNTYARTIRTAAIRKGQAQGFTEEQIEAAIRNYVRQEMRHAERR